MMQSFYILLAKGAFITNAEANFMEFSISIKDGIKYLVLKGLNIRLKCDLMWKHKQFFQRINGGMKFALQLVKGSRKLCLFIY